MSTKTTFLTHKWRSKTVVAHRFRGSLVMCTFWWWCHNRSRNALWDATIVTQHMKSDIDSDVTLFMVMFTVGRVRSVDSWAPFQYQIWRLIIRSREVSKPRDWQFILLHRFEIWQAPRQQCCRGACRISERSDNSKYKSRGFDFPICYDKTSYLILKRGAGPTCWFRCIGLYKTWSLI